MPPTHTRRGARRRGRRSAERFPNVGVLVLSQYVEAEYALGCSTRRTAGVGYLLKERVLDVDDLVAALRRVAAGETVVDPALVAAAARPPPRATTRSTELTPREREVLALMAEGLTDRGIAERLFVTPNTVETHVRHIFGKLSLPATPPTTAASTPCSATCAPVREADRDSGASPGATDDAEGGRVGVTAGRADSATSFTRDSNSCRPEPSRQLPSRRSASRRLE